MNKSYKIIIIGDSSVGKTALVNCWTKGINTVIDTQPTTAAACSQCKAFVHDQMHSIAVWDTAGEEKYKSMAPIYARGAIGAVLTFDLTNRQSFESIPSWIQGVSDITTIKFILAGNKSDLEDKRQISFDEAVTFAHNNNIEYIETSALNGTGVEDLFISLLTEAIPKELEIDPEPPKEAQQQTKKEGCC